MTFHAKFVKFREADSRPMPMGLSVQVMANSASDAMQKLKGLVGAGRWPALADAVRLFENGVEVDSFIPALDECSARPNEAPPCDQ